MVSVFCLETKHLEDLMSVHIGWIRSTIYSQSQCSVPLFTGTLPQNHLHLTRIKHKMHLHQLLQRESAHLQQHFKDTETLLWLLTTVHIALLLYIRIFRDDIFAFIAVLNSGKESFRFSQPHLTNKNCLATATLSVRHSFHLIRWKMKVQQGEKLKCFGLREWNTAQSIEQPHRSSLSLLHNTQAVCVALSVLSECQTQFWRPGEHKPITLLLTYLNLIMGHLSLMCKCSHQA